MKCVVDIGSNSVRMLIGFVENGAVQVVEQSLFTTRLGKTAVGGCLSVEGRQKTIDALLEFKKLCQKHSVTEDVLVTATSAVREASDGADFAKEIWDKLGWKLVILSGEQEAYYSYLGASSVVKGDAAVIDVGGGSTEMIYQGVDGLKGVSVKVGAVRLQVGEVTQEQLPEILQPLLEVLPTDLAEREKLQFVSVGGTITTLDVLKLKLPRYERELVSGTVLNKADLGIIKAELEVLTLAERVAAYPLLAGREDIILDGILIYETLMDLANIEEIIVSDSGILDGLLLGYSK